MKLITANRFSDGAVVFLSGEEWKTDIAASAPLATDSAVEAGLAFAEQAFRKGEVIDVAAIEIRLDEQNKPIPLRLRERIRAFGPTISYGEAAVPVAA